MQVHKFGWMVLFVVLIAGFVVFADSVAMGHRDVRPASAEPAPAIVPDGPPQSNEIGELQQQG
jgi:hypothetical protein